MLADDFRFVLISDIVVVDTLLETTSTANYSKSAYKIKNAHMQNMYLLLLCPLHPWGEGGHLNLLWFPVTQMCVGIRLCQMLFTRNFLQFFVNGFQILRYGDHGQDLELINFL